MPAHLADYPVQPQHIDATRRFWDSFDKLEREDAARCIVLLCQELGNWGPFTRAQIQEFYDRHMRHTQAPFLDRGLFTNFARIEGEQIYMTEEFVARCFRSSPVKA